MPLFEVEEKNPGGELCSITAVKGHRRLGVATEYSHCNGVQTRGQGAAEDRS